MGVIGSMTKMLFVGGLHRSGTSLLYQVIGTDPKVSSFTNTGVIEDEGQFLQDVMAPDGSFGGPGCFSFHPEAHLTEVECVDREAIYKRLMNCWGPYWNLARPILAEKTPANIVRSRFLQGVFDDAYFIFMIRHPLPVMMATSKWTGSYMRTLMRHWLHAHEIMDRDRTLLNSSLVVRYEDIESDREGVVLALEELLKESLDLKWPVIKTDINRRYIASFWRGDHRLRSGAKGWRKAFKRVRNIFECVTIALLHEFRVRKYGYSFFPPYVLKKINTNKVRAIRNSRHSG